MCLRTRSVREAPNGKLFQVGGEAVQPNLLVAHVYGTPMEMGRAYGALLSQEIQQVLGEFNTYLESQVCVVAMAIAWAEIR